MEIAILIAVVIAYAFLWYKKWKIALIGTLVLGTVGGGWYWWYWFNNDHQRDLVTVSADLRYRAIGIQDTGTQARVEVPLDSFKTREEFNRIYKRKSGKALPESDLDELFDYIESQAPYPLRVVIHNGSKKTVEKVDFSIGVYSKGRSTDLSKYQTYTSDKILKSGESDTSFWAIPIEKQLDGELKDYTFKVKYDLPTFE